MMTSLLSRHLLTTCILFFVWSAVPALGQAVPADLEIIGTAGGLALTAEYATVHISPDGNGTYHRFVADDPMTPALESNSFALTTAELQQLWQAIQTNNFFNLQPEHVNEEIGDRTFAELIVIANGATHTVTTQNIAVEPFDAIISILNNLTPGDDDLVYDVTEPLTFTPLDVCDQPGKRGQSPPSKEGKESNKGEQTAESVVEMVSAAAVSSALNESAHPGTTVAYRMTLREAVDRGIVSLSGKGEFYGDAVSISVDNSSSVTSDQLNLSLYLELWGPAASASTSQAVSNAIVNAWGGKTTTGGQTLIVDVLTRTTPGGTSAPGTEGFHQIKLVADSSYASNVEGRGSSFDVNEGVGSGTWSTTGSEANAVYAHEAGHLLGLDDYYEVYRKQADDTWTRESDGENFTSSELADELAPRRPDLTTAEIQAKLEDGRRRASAPEAGHENDLMAILKGAVQQSDIDAISAQAGLVIEIRPGDILVNKDGSEQNFAITRSEDVFVPAGGSKTLDGLYAACIDRWKETPGSGVVFDLGPSLSDWAGIESAQVLQQLLDYTNEQERFCGGDLNAQWATWRITDNHLIGDVDAEAYLEEAGIDMGRRLLEFPRMSNPSPFRPATTALMPPQLFVPVITTSPGDVVRAGETVTLSAAVLAPSLEGVSISFSWSLDAPGASAAVLSREQGETTSFTPDARGFYQVQLQVLQTGGVSGSRVLSASVFITTVDTRTETFESWPPSAESSYQWGTTPDSPWIVTDEASNTGASSIASAIIDDGAATGVQATFVQAAAGPLSFAYKVSSEPRFDVLWFFIGDEVQGSWSGEVDWSIFSMDLPAGAHTATWLYVKDESGWEGADRAWLDDVFFSVDATFTAVEDPLDDELPAVYQLFQNYPNPFNSTTTISYAIPEPQHVRLVVYDALGRQVAVLVEVQMNAGNHRVRFDARGLSNGIYHYELRSGTFTERKAMVLSR